MGFIELFGYKLNERFILKAPLCKGGSRRSRVGDCPYKTYVFTIPPSPNGATSLYTKEALDKSKSLVLFTPNRPLNQNSSNGLEAVGAPILLRTGGSAYE